MAMGWTFMPHLFVAVAKRSPTLVPKLPLGNAPAAKLRLATRAIRFDATSVGNDVNRPRAMAQPKLATECMLL